MIELYLNERCPYCVTVRRYAEEAGITYLLKPIPLYKSTPLEEDLIRRGGIRQVPYLVDTEREVEMYESEDIVAYLKKHYAH